MRSRSEFRRRSGKKMKDVQKTFLKREIGLSDRRTGRMVQSTLTGGKEQRANLPRTVMLLSTPSQDGGEKDHI